MLLELSLHLLWNVFRPVPLGAVVIQEIQRRLYRDVWGIIIAYAEPVVISGSVRTLLYNRRAKCIAASPDLIASSDGIGTLIYRGDKLLVEHRLLAAKSLAIIQNKVFAYTGKNVFQISLGGEEKALSLFWDPVDQYRLSQKFAILMGMVATEKELLIQVLLQNPESKATAICIVFDAAALRSKTPAYQWSDPPSAKYYTHRNDLFRLRNTGELERIDIKTGIALEKRRQLPSQNKITDIAVGQRVVYVSETKDNVRQLVAFEDGREGQKIECDDIQPGALALESETSLIVSDVATGNIFRMQ